MKYFVYYLRNVFNEYRQNLPSYFENEEVALLWTFHPNIIFNRTDLFIRRLQIIEVRLTIANIKRTLFSRFTCLRLLNCRSGFLILLSSSRNSNESNSAVLKVDCSVPV